MAPTRVRTASNFLSHRRSNLPSPYTPTGLLPARLHFRNRSSVFHKLISDGRLLSQIKTFSRSVSSSALLLKCSGYFSPPPFPGGAPVIFANTCRSAPWVGLYLKEGRILMAHQKRVGSPNTAMISVITFVTLSGNEPFSFI